jgi:hypothetical protein
MIITNSLAKAQARARRHHEKHAEEVLIFHDPDWGFVVVTQTEVKNDPELDDMRLVDVYDYI